LERGWRRATSAEAASSSIEFVRGSETGAAMRENMKKRKKKQEEKERRNWLPSWGAKTKPWPNSPER